MNGDVYMHMVSVFYQQKKQEHIYLDSNHKLISITVIMI